MSTKNNPGTFDCYAAADPDEEMFILLARDDTAPERIREWARKRNARLRQLRGKAWDKEHARITEALSCADRMQAQHDIARQARNEGCTIAELLARRTHIGPTDV